MPRKKSAMASTEGASGVAPGLETARPNDGTWNALPARAQQWVSTSYFRGDGWGVGGFTAVPPEPVWRGSGASGDGAHDVSGGASGGGGGASGANDGLAHGRKCLGAFTVALNQACDGQRWYTSTRDLQLASLAFCVACRNVTTLRLRVDNNTPPRLLGAADAPQPQSDDRGSSRVPRLRARAVLWNRASVVELYKPIYALVDVKIFHLCVDEAIVGSVADVAWPAGIELITFQDFNKPIESVAWPASLQELDVGHYFNQPIERVAWPSSLQKLYFRAQFNRPIESVAWPASLQQVHFGFDFNQPIESVEWPAAIRLIDFGDSFNQPVESVAWPASLEVLYFWEFNQPIELVAWPGSLQQLVFDEFNQPIESVVWPASLQRLQLGCKFNQPVTRVAWPSSLQCLKFGHFDCDVDSYLSRFNQRIDKAVWPASLLKVEFGPCFRQSVRGLGTWMPNLEELELHSDDYTRDFNDMEWPKGLKILRVDYYRNGNRHDGSAIPPSVKVDGFL